MGKCARKNRYLNMYMLRSLKLKLHWPWLILFLAGCASVGITQYDPWDQLYGLDSPKIEW